MYIALFGPVYAGERLDSGCLHRQMYVGKQGSSWIEVDELEDAYLWPTLVEAFVACEKIFHGNPYEIYFSREGKSQNGPIVNRDEIIIKKRKLFTLKPKKEVGK